jgi:V8-like Glu-specific endopeptidase
MTKEKLSFRFISIATVAFLAGYASIGFANDVTSANPTSITSLSAADQANAQSRLPMLTDPSQLPPKVRESLGLDGDGFSSDAYGTGGHPFTTKRATTLQGGKFVARFIPYSPTGKLWMRFGSSWFVCSASLIENGVLATAAHCVWDYGVGPADEVYFEPARHEAEVPFGQWNAVEWIVPMVYANGTDVCTTFGIVCQNDVAVVVLEQQSGQNLIEFTKYKYNWRDNDYSYTNFLGETAAQITELGYPAAFDGGEQMIRTDSLGYQDVPSNVIIGTDQTGGSSGGPWLVNFGISPSSTSTPPIDNLSNTVMATTSWGYTSSSIKVQGASRFAENSIFNAGSSNIEVLVNEACTTYPSNC